ncbi:MAG: D-glycerate dehydrogenase [Gemmataceae bacterium]
MPKVFVTRRIPAAGLDRLRAAGCDLDIWPGDMPPPRDEIVRRVADCDGLLCLLTEPIDVTVLAAAPKLKVVSIMAVGYNNIDVKTATARGIVVGNTPGVLTEATADLAVALMLAAARCLRVGHEDIAAGKWRTWEPLGYIGQDLAGKTVGIVGLGRIGAAFAKRCRGGWGMRVLYHNPRPKPDAAAELDATLVDLATLLRESDVVSLHCPLTAYNRGLMGRPQFAAMKKTAVFVNTARGPLVDQTALHEALESGTIFAAGIDVTEPEPPDPADPLLKLPNLVVVPHVGSATVATRDAMATIAAENLIAGLQGKPLPHAVTP